MAGSLTPSRRQFLRRATGIVAVGVLAGCAGDGSDTVDAEDGTAGGGNTGDGSTGDGTDADGGSGTTAGSSTPTAAPATDSNGTTKQGDLDLREANVVDVALSTEGSTTRFDVTLYHDDDGEEGYANWWQVETPAGEQLGRRDLAHPHGTTRFTRSAAVEVPDDLDCVVVRGHDQTHGYGGQAMVVSVNSGATGTVRQGTDPQEFAGSACP
jgi:hypothetical protein